ncbi:MAG: NhaP-type Na+/H+ or K+/H+ antiporter [Cellvibrionaceae bacterium]|jgi:NhaP-type Na+/H+ or K+/H+ antiporter
MHQSVAIGLTTILVLGISAQWVAWRFKIPSILLLLVFGFIAGPVTGFIHPDELFGELLFPLVSLSVAIILFEGGLSLKRDEIGGVESVVRLLVSLGALVSWAVTSLAAFYILELDLFLSLLLGGVLVVTGPTVVMPLLKQIRPVARVSSVLKWEGILIDPVGATLAVLIFEGIIGRGDGHQLTIWSIASGIVITLLVGSVVGSGFAYALIQFMKRNWIAPFLETAVVLMMVVAAFALSNVLREEAGLMAVTIMGIILVNQKQVSISHIIHFKEELVVLLLSILFIILAARVDLDALIQVGWQEVVFLLTIIFVARPLSVLASTVFSNMPWKERMFVSAMAPRGIVAVSVASLFALELHEAGFENADQLVNVTFFVVVGTVLTYSILSRPFASLLGLIEKAPQGTLIVGAHYWAREIAKSIQKAGFDVWLVDTNSRQIEYARQANLQAVQADIMDDRIFDDLPIESIGRLLAMTANSELNALSTLHLSSWVGNDNVYRLASVQKGAQSIAKNLSGRILFDETLHFNKLDGLYYQDAKIETLSMADVKEIENQLDKESLFAPLLYISNLGQLHVITHKEKSIPATSKAVIYLTSSDVTKKLETLQLKQIKQSQETK